MIVNSHNDWDPLEEIIVGHAHHSRIATDISARSFSYANFPKEDVEKLEGPYPQWVIDEANEDADGLAKRFWDENKGGLGDITVRSQQNNSKTQRVRKRANRKTSTLRGANRLKEIKVRRASLGISQWGKGTWGKRDASKRK